MRDARPLLLVVALAGGVFVGFVAGRVTAPLTSGDPALEGEVLTAISPTIDSEARPSRSSAATDPSGAGRPRVGDATAARPGDAAGHEHGPTAAELLRRLAPSASDERIAQAEQRADALRAHARGAERSAAHVAAREIADAVRKERAFLADQASGGTMTMLRKLKDADVRPFALVEDAATFSTHFERTTTGPAIDPTAEEVTAAPEPGTVLRYPAGLHILRVRQWGRGGDFPGDVVIEGAGRDATVVRFDEFSARGIVRNLTFRDVTVDAGDSYLTDLRSEEPVTIRMERCRVIGFDIGAGGSVMLAARTAAFYASDTLFEAGWGRSPGSGNLFRVRSGLLARMERCTFVGPFRSVYDTNAAATYVFDTCRFVNRPVPLDAPPDGVRFVDCENVTLEGGEDADRTAWFARAAFPTEDGALVVDGVAGKVPEGTTGPVVLVFPAGEHTLVAGRNLGAYRGPLIVRGQGRDATLLRVGGQPQASALVVRDVTVDLGHSPVIGSQVRVARLERVRLVGWDSGSGGSTALDQRTGVLTVLHDCEVVDGFGRAPGRGTFASIDRGTLRIERSTIGLVGSRFLRGGGRVVLLDSTVSGVPAEELDPKSGAHRNLSVVRSTLAPLPAGFEKPKEPRPLSDLNSAWGRAR